MTHTKRKELEQLSIKAFGSPYAYQARMRKPSHYIPDRFGSVQGKRAAGYATIEQIEEVMIRIIEERENANID